MSELGDAFAPMPPQVEVPTWGIYTIGVGSLIALGYIMYKIIKEEEWL